MAPILTSLSRSVVSDQCSTSFGKTARVTQVDYGEARRLSRPVRARTGIAGAALPHRYARAAGEGRIGAEMPRVSPQLSPGGGAGWLENKILRGLWWKVPLPRTTWVTLAVLPKEVAHWSLTTLRA